jgi:hypothetical protein
MRRPPNPEYIGKDRVHRVVADLLCSTLSREGRSEILTVWEDEALRWLSEEWERNPSLSWNGWTASRVHEWRRGETVKTGT